MMLAAASTGAGALGESVPWYFYLGFLGFVILMLLVDLKLFHAESHEPTVRQSATWVGIWMGLAVAFGIGLLIFADGQTAAEYFAGYLIEYSLSVDNMFVFVVIFGYFSVPLAYQHQVLFFGILGAIFFRGIFIALGTALIHNFEWIVYIFGAFLIFTAYRIGKGAAEHVDPAHNPILRFFQSRFRTTTRFDGQKLFTMENGKRVATPLFIVLLFVETTDILFAVDSIPAIFAVTTRPFIVLTSNVFAILGLRALYFLLAGSMGRFHLLKYGLAIILGFVGVKMLLGAVDIHIPIWLSLSVIIGVLLITGILSLKLPPPETKEEVPHPGVDRGTADATRGDPETSEALEAADEEAPPSGRT